MIYSEITINGQQIKLIPLGKCACGCGGKTKISPETDRTRFRLKGQPYRFLMGHGGNIPGLHWSKSQIPQYPIGYCQCGCGGKTTKADRTVNVRGIIAGLPMPFLLNHAQRIRSRERSSNWHGGITIKDGYRYIYDPKHARANMRGYVREHILIAERVLGKSLPPGAVIHHVNEDKSDNRPENLVICQDNAYHRLLHIRMKANESCGNPHFRRCIYCKQWDSPDNLYFQKSGTIWHRKCRNNYVNQFKIAKSNLKR